MVINEIFYSIQGEGLLTGIPCVFIRLAGCPVGCSWCDTKYALDPKAGEDFTIEQIINKTRQWNCKYAVLTGGEPMINPQLPELAEALKKQGKHITIETAGIQFTPDLSCDLMSVSPKILSNIEPVKQLISHYSFQLKFVVDSPEDLPGILECIQSLGDIDPAKIMLMPQAKNREELLVKSPMVAELCKQTGFSFCNRLQILLYDGQKGK